MLRCLLSPETAPLISMQVWRVQLDRVSPHVIIDITMEMCVYALMGSVDVLVDAQRYGTLGARRSVCESDVQAFRVVPGVGTVLRLTKRTETADMLIVTAPWYGQAPSPQYVPGHHLHMSGDVYEHAVGTGTYARIVRELPTPRGYTIHAGETVSEGTWSSWPSHATPEEVSRFAEHQEVFLNFTTGYALMRMDGRYATGEVAQKVVEIHNNEAIVTPLGSHEVVCSPGAWYMYVWAYTSFLQKTYNRFADHLDTYIK